MDLKEFLEQNNVTYYTHGKNVSKNHINIRCRFCNDHSNHLGINKFNLKCYCWKCGGHYFIDLIQIISNCTKSQAFQIYRKIKKSRYSNLNIIAPEKDRTLKFPVTATKDFPSLHLNYLEKRGFIPKKLIKKYDLYAVGLDNPNYKFRIIIPIKLNHQTVSFTSRDVTNSAHLKYKTATSDESLIDPSNLVFGIDNVRQGSDLLVTEGVFDVFKFGHGSVCLLGTKLSVQRLRAIKSKMIRTCFVCLDNDETGIRESKIIKDKLAPVTKKIKILRLRTVGDIGDMSFDDIAQLKHQIKFNN
jgi:hypothetical protein